MKSFLNWQFIVVMLLFAAAGRYLVLYVRGQVKGTGKDSCPECDPKKKA